MLKKLSIPIIRSKSRFPFKILYSELCILPHFSWFWSIFCCQLTSFYDVLCTLKLIILEDWFLHYFVIETCLDRGSVQFSKNVHFCSTFFTLLSNWYWDASELYYFLIWANLLGKYSLFCIQKKIYKREYLQFFFNFSKKIGKNCKKNKRIPENCNTQYLAVPKFTFGAYFI